MRIPLSFKWKLTKLTYKIEDTQIISISAVHRVRGFCSNGPIIIIIIIIAIITNASTQKYVLVDTWELRFQKVTWLHGSLLVRCCCAKSKMQSAPSAHRRTFNCIRQVQWWQRRRPLQPKRQRGRNRIGKGKGKKKDEGEEVDATFCIHFLWCLLLLLLLIETWNWISLLAKSFLSLLFIDAIMKGQGPWEENTPKHKSTLPLSLSRW